MAQVKILSSIITSVLPGIVLTIFLALLPTILSLLNKKVQKMVSETDVEFGVVRKYFVFQVCWITTMPSAITTPSWHVKCNIYCEMQCLLDSLHCNCNA